MCMSIISRAIDQVNIEESYENIVRNQCSRGRTDDFQISPTVFFTRSCTKKEEHVRNHEMRLDQEEEERAKARRREEMCAESRYQHPEYEPEPPSHNVLHTSQPPCNLENSRTESITRG